MSEADLVADLKASINDSVSVFTGAADADFKRHLALAAIAMHEKRPRTLVGTLTLVANQAAYDPPTGLQGYKSHLWGITPIASPKPWEKGYPGRLPDVRLIEPDGDPDALQLYLDPAPTSAQISVLGSEFRYYYYAKHAIGAAGTDTTIRAIDRRLLLLRAQAEAMRELANRNITKPVVMRDAMSSTPRNGTPSYLYEKFLQEFRDAPAH